MIQRHTREELEDRRAHILAELPGVGSAKDLWDIAGMRELTPEEEAALNELRRIQFLLNES
jgi:hypothetical protein